MHWDQKEDFIYDKSILAQVVSWCHEAISHCLDQCPTRSPKPYKCSYIGTGWLKASKCAFTRAGTSNYIPQILWGVISYSWPWYLLLAHKSSYTTSWWRYQMETFSALLALCAGISPVHKGQWRGALMFSLICAWINGSVNNREAGDLRRYRAHYDVTVM